ncbi:uncharacterized protein VICG_01779 [Vittaforma corneae ATCC 50505]|uniref:RRM domain-containing protein n=1 Tax=Vittaforma corneae (strain ATCC 50505) TaxID=993615 RepID=L2GL18_VITCO|nr:uncharacterized protein VICG_01779 [Vittaforma corneae ATCC 50505]ELA41180.1 hypothetical protein VICG_01779 [Vittaforma corneae ATCC 50505]
MRVVVKNLPETTSKSEIEIHFAKQGNVTDVYMLVNSKNQFRRICFIGYSSSEEAVSAVKYFDNTYFKNHKIKVEIAQEESKNVEANETKLRRALYSKTIVVKNIGEDMSEDAIAESLNSYGAVENVQVEKKKNSSTGHAIAIVKFKRGRMLRKLLKI